MKYLIDYLVELSGPWGSEGCDTKQKSFEAASDEQAVEEARRLRSARLYRELPLQSGVNFTVEQVAALCGGLPEELGFDWGSVEHFRLEEGVLQPYAGGDILPGPGIELGVRIRSL